MSPHFIQNVAAHQEEKACTLLLKLWREKIRLAQGRPFQIAEDVDALLLDTMFAVTFGTMTGALEASIGLLSSTNSLTILPVAADDPVQFEKAQQKEIYHAIETLALSSEIGIKSPFGVHHHRIALKWIPSLVAAGKVKERFITERLRAAWEKFNQSQESEDDIQSAADLLVSREVKLAAKQGRAPQYDSRSVHDELLMIVIGGWDTTSSAVKWSAYSRSEPSSTPC
jgi:cytochrome P450